MKKIKKRVLTLLLITFAFFVVHDYVVHDMHHGVNYELSYKVYDKSDMQNKIHDSIHTILNFNLKETLFIETKLLDAKPSSIILSLSSNTSQVPQRPPLI